MNIFQSISKLFMTPIKAAEKYRDWTTLLKMLGKSQSTKEMKDIVQAIIRIGDKKAASAIVDFILECYKKGEIAGERRAALSLDPNLLLLESMRKQGDIFTIGYDSREIHSPIYDANIEVGTCFNRGHEALEALVGLKAIEEIQAVLDNPAVKEQYRENFNFALKKINKVS